MDPLNNIRISKELLLKFFICFSRFEFALKTSGFALGNLRHVKPDWDGYTKSIKDIFDKNKSQILFEAVDYFRLIPPWKQILMPDGTIGWDSSAPNDDKSEIEKIIILIRRVRNNLFHGGKFSNEVFENKERTELLLERSLIILEECLIITPHVMRQFNEATI